MILGIERHEALSSEIMEIIYNYGNFNLIEIFTNQLKLEF